MRATPSLIPPPPPPPDLQNFEHSTQRTTRGVMASSCCCVTPAKTTTSARVVTAGSSVRAPDDHQDHVVISIPSSSASVATSGTMIFNQRAKESSLRPSGTFQDGSTSSPPMTSTSSTPDTPCSHFRGIMSRRRGAEGRTGNSGGSSLWGTHLNNQLSSSEFPVRCAGGHANQVKIFSAAGHTSSPIQYPSTSSSSYHLSTYHHHHYPLSFPSVVAASTAHHTPHPHLNPSQSILSSSGFNLGTAHSSPFIHPHVQITPQMTIASSANIPSDPSAPINPHELHLNRQPDQQTSGTNAMSGIGYQSNNNSSSNHRQHKKPSRPRRRIATVAQRRAANIRERRRMFNLNSAFDKLRKKVPTFAYEKRLSRIDTLRLAMTYIRFMSELLEEEDSPALTDHSHNHFTSHKGAEVSRSDLGSVCRHQAPPVPSSCPLTNGLSKINLQNHSSLLISRL